EPCSPADVRPSRSVRGGHAGACTPRAADSSRCSCADGERKRTVAARASLHPLLVIAEARERAGVVRPAFTNLYPQAQVHFHAVLLLERLARAHADLFQPFAGLSDQNRLLAFLLGPDGRLDIEPALAALVARHLDGDGVRNFLSVQCADLLAHHFAGEETRTLVGQLILGINRRLLRQERYQRAFQSIQVIARARG